MFCKKHCTVGWKELRDGVNPEWQLVPVSSDENQLGQALNWHTLEPSDVVFKKWSYQKLMISISFDWLCTEVYFSDFAVSCYACKTVY